MVFAEQFLHLRQGLAERGRLAAGELRHRLDAYRARLALIRTECQSSSAPSRSRSPAPTRSRPLVDSCRHGLATIRVSATVAGSSR
jgi:hypothetical protein